MNHEVQHYGLHMSPDGVQFLHQHQGTGHNFIGFKKPSPFEVVFNTVRRPMCPHNINPNVGHPDSYHWADFMDLYEDPFFRAFLPIPRNTFDPIPYLNDTADGRWITMAVVLSRLASPVAPLVIPWGKLRFRELTDALRVTNVAPLVIHSVTSEDQQKLTELVTGAQILPRKLILLGSPDVVVRSPMIRIRSTLDKLHPHKLLALPLESLGAVALRRHARGEQINSTFMKKDSA